MSVSFMSPQQRCRIQHLLPPYVSSEIMMMTFRRVSSEVKAFLMRHGV